MNIPRRAAKVDANQQEIVRALISAGCSVYPIGQPLDLLVGRAGVNYLLEVKNRDGRDKLEPLQQLFLRDWNGHAAVVRSAEDALAAVGLGNRTSVKVLSTPNA
jgi:hypothetical protein